ncbi:hypothetical protein BBJ29_004859 [Phytophthora kernoviae]|uniref:non-specific serine/threonine protein kinase n=1 Tax=Phytophthora kernoviae TaxID=325452 RepID=A0A421GBQ4_9STRA|nr:hypothetical protein BBJ29_004859 [Phytophthora kernoviae]
MQDLMDEALALSLYEEECRALQREINPEYQSSVFTNLQRNKERREEDRNKELLNADSFDSMREAAGEGAVKTSVLTRTPAASAGAAALARARVSGSLSMEDAAHGAGGGKGFTSLRENQRRHQKSEKKGFGAGRVEAEAHATIDGVMDERTTLILQKMINKGELDEVHGCVQSGKEAHVYFAVGTDEVTLQPVQLAVKIFRTTLNEFSNRHEYVTGDRRFDLNFQKKDLRRQLKSWTDKEYRNLCRVTKCNIRAPTPVVCKEHVLVMQFVGAEGWPEPTLKDVQADWSVKQQARAYADVLQATRALYQRAHLVHGDLSEYNILYALQEKRCWLIDFGQAVDRSHPDTEKFLRRDLHTINRFFQRGDLLEASAEEPGLLSDEQAYEYVVSETPGDVVDAFPPLAALLEELTDVPEGGNDLEEETEEGKSEQEETEQEDELKEASEVQKAGVQEESEKVEPSSELDLTEAHAVLSSLSLCYVEFDVAPLTFQCCSPHRLVSAMTPNQWPTRSCRLTISVSHASVSVSNPSTPLDGVDNHQEGDALSPEKRGSVFQWVVGCVFLVCVAIIWNFSSVLIQYIFNDLSFEAPFFLTSFGMALFSINLPIYYITKVLLPQMKQGIATSELPQVKPEASQQPETQSPHSKATLKRTMVASAIVAPLWFIANFTYNESLNLTSVTSSTILSATSSVFTLILGIWILKERFTWAKFLGVALCMAGNCTTLANDSSGGISEGFWGDVCALIGAIMYGVYTTAIRKYIPDDAGMSVSLFFGFVGLFSLVILAIFVIIFNYSGVESLHNLTWEIVGLLFVQGLLNNVLADYLWAVSIMYTSTTVATVGLSLTVPMAILSDWIVNDISPNYVTLISSVLVLGGFVVIAFNTRQEQLRAESEAKAEAAEVPSPKSPATSYRMSMK